MIQDRIRVLVADDHPSVRENLRYLIDAEPDLRCIGVARDGTACLEACRTLAPQVLVLDNTMPPRGGVSVTRTLEREQPGVRVVMYTLEREACAIATAFGAAACVLKDAPYQSLLDAIRTAARTETAAN